MVARRVTTPLFSAGLIDAITDGETVLGPLRTKPTGIAGRVAMVTDVVSGQKRIGRCGWKAQQKTLLAFAGDAYLHEMGIMNRFLPMENAPIGNMALLARFARVPDLENKVDPADVKSDMDRLEDFMSRLAPPPRSAVTGNAVAGERLVASIDGVSCHTPAMRTSKHEVAALIEKTAGLYSDLLRHDVGAPGAGIAQGAAGGREMRTAPFWGLRARSAWLSDGRAVTVDAAIRGHDGEAAAARDKYGASSAADRAAVPAFLNTL